MGNMSQRDEAMKGWESLGEELAQIREKGLWRRLRRLDGANEAATHIEGRDVLLLSSNNYLGLATDPRVKGKAIEAIERYGAGSGGARLTTGNLALHEELEKSIAAFKGYESAIVFSSGYLANLGTISALMGEGDLILSDALNHASIIDGCRLSKAQTWVYRHADMQDLEEKLRRFAGFRRKLIVTDGVFSMDGDIAPLPRIVELAERYGAWVMVDDAHATGVLGKNGAGTVEHFGLAGRVQLALGTLSKAVGAEGGFVAASRTVIDYLRNRARPFIFQTALSPGVVAAALEALRLMREEPVLRERLMENARYLREGLGRLGFSLVPGETPIIAVLIGDAQKAVDVSRRLEELGIYAPAIRPPTVPQGQSRIRVTVMATHTREQLEQALACFARAGRELGLLG
ncbi:glycine C-acetyltransferase [Bacillaceae bacterium]